jgi:hypothetical protein
MPWADVLERRPDSVRAATLDWEWTRDWLWSLDLVAGTVAVGSFAWIYELPMWKAADGTPFVVTPRQVMLGPVDYPGHSDRIAHADMSWPIHTTSWRGRTIVLDGLHRLAHATLSGQSEISACDVPPAVMTTQR